MKTTKVVYLLDASGSMKSYKSNVMKALDSYFEGLSKDGETYEVSLYQFSNMWRPKVKTVCTSVPVKAVPKADTFFMPDGRTPLYQSILDVCSMHNSENDVLFVIQTDGKETEWHEGCVDAKARIRFLKKHQNWQFLYLGANQNAEQYGEQLGIGSGNSLSWETDKADLMARELQYATTQHSQSGGTQRNDTFTGQKKKTNRKVNWDPAQHPRDGHGKFVSLNSVKP